MTAPLAALPGRYAKFLTALAGNALVYADATYGSTNRWVELATAAAVASSTAPGVVRNRSSSRPRGISPWMSIG